jgi:hypothetical protein
MNYCASLCALVLAAGLLHLTSQVCAAEEPAAPTTPGSTSDTASQAALPPGFVSEAPLPEGFPLPSAPGEVVEKEYPALRSYSATGPNAFFRCFNYLQQKKHEMTAPVVMDYEPGAAIPSGGRAEMPVPVKRMHFLLEKVSQDEPREQGNVQVADMQPMRVLSIAYQGRLTPDVVKDLDAKIEEALKKRPEIKAGGQRRILGYNSPMIPPAKDYWELQLPVVAAQP